MNRRQFLAAAGAAVGAVVALMLPPLGRRYVAGLQQAPACPVYVSRGLGVTQVPIRFLCPPEVTLITLVKP